VAVAVAAAAEAGVRTREERRSNCAGRREREIVCVRDWTIRRSGEEHREEWVCEIEYRKKERKRIKQYTKDENKNQKKRSKRNWRKS